VEHRIRGLIGAAMREKGYLEDNAKPDFIVRFGAGTSEETSGDVEMRFNLKDDAVDLGKIQVDAFDASTKVAVWRGSAVSHIDLTKDIDNGLLQRAVQGIFNTFPVRSATVGQPAAQPVSDGGAG
jgi:hypothetical protein